MPIANPPVLVANLTVDKGNSTLYACVDVFAPGFMMPKGEVRAYDYDGKLKRSYPLPNQGTSVCEDIAIDAQHNIYVTDAFLGKVYSAAVGGQLTELASSDLLKPGNNPVPPFGAHGLTWAGNALYVDNFNTSALVRLPLNGDGTAGAITTVTVTPALTNPEALRTLDDTHLLVTEDLWGSPDGKLAILTLDTPTTASTTVLRNDIEGPTSVAVANGSYWVTESQISKLLGGLQPNLPFKVQRIVQQEP